MKPMTGAELLYSLTVLKEPESVFVLELLKQFPVNRTLYCSALHPGAGRGRRFPSAPSTALCLWLRSHVATMNILL
jgi:hypothetical protein